MSALVAHKARVPILALDESGNSFFSRAAKAPVSDKSCFELLSTDQERFAISRNFATAIFTVPELCGHCATGERNRGGSRDKNHQVAQAGAPVSRGSAGIQQSSHSAHKSVPILGQDESGGADALRRRRRTERISLAYSITSTMRLD